MRSSDYSTLVTVEWNWTDEGPNTVSATHFDRVKVHELGTFVHQLINVSDVLGRTIHIEIEGKYYERILEKRSI